MVPAAVVDKSIADLAPLLEAGDILIDGGNSYYVDDIRARQGTRAEGHRLCRRRHERRRLGPGPRLLHDDRRPRRRRCSISIPSSRRWRRASARSTARRGARKLGGTAELRLPALRAQRRRPLRQDGAQRHRIRHHGRLRRGSGRTARREHRQTHPRHRRRDDAAARSRALSIRSRICATSPKSGGAAA